MVTIITAMKLIAKSWKATSSYSLTDTTVFQNETPESQYRRRFKLIPDTSSS